LAFANYSAGVALRSCFVGAWIDQDGCDPAVVLVFDVEQQQACLRGDGDFDLVGHLQAATAFPVLLLDQDAQVVTNALLAAFVECAIERQTLQEGLPGIRKRLGDQLAARFLSPGSEQPVEQHAVTVAVAISDGLPIPRLRLLPEATRQEVPGAAVARSTGCPARHGVVLFRQAAYTSGMTDAPRIHP